MAEAGIVWDHMDIVELGVGFSAEQMVRAWKIKNEGRRDLLFPKWTHKIHVLFNGWIFSNSKNPNMNFIQKLFDFCMVYEFIQKF